jgi:YD repeat-containing protein
MDYDDANQLTSVAGSPTNSTVDMGYDLAGNRTSFDDSSDSTGPWSFGHNENNQIRSASGASQSITPTYDLNGNQLSYGGQAYEWDAANRMVKITIGSETSEFSYDGLGRL